MKSVGIIAEYNPFHYGHQYHLTKTREQSGADAVVVVMSGDFTQRGEVALYDKYRRAQAAVLFGADVVVMLPFAYSCQTAELFAFGGVSTLAALKAEAISFGCEDNDIALLKKAAHLLAYPSDEMEESLRNHLTQGRSYAKARQLALAALCTDCAALLDKPNNILAVEYLKQIALHHYPMSAIAVTREGATHDSPSYQGNIASASSIRSLICAGEDASSFLPHSFTQLPHNEIKHYRDILYQNLLLSDANKLRRYPEISGGLEYRMLKTFDDYMPLEQYIAQVSNKHHTKSRIRRSLCHLLTDFTLSFKEIKSSPVPYLRLLAFNETGRAYLNQLQPDPPVISNLADAMKKTHGYAKTILTYDILASNLYQLAVEEKKNTDYFRTPIYC